MSLAYSPGLQPHQAAINSQMNLEARVSSPISIFAPQGRAPVQFNQAPSRTESRPDFSRGFGIDIPEEEEEEELAPAIGDMTAIEPPRETEINEVVPEALSANNVENPDLREGDIPNQAAHGRHASRVSVALSVASLTKNVDETMVDPAREVDIEMPSRTANDHSIEPEVDEVLNEWTGSESGDQLSDDEEVSIFPLIFSLYLIFLPINSEYWGMV